MSKQREVSRVYAIALSTCILAEGGFREIMLRVGSCTMQSKLLQWESGIIWLSFATNYASNLKLKTISR